LNLEDEFEMINDHISANEEQCLAAEDEEIPEISARFHFEAL
jgi:hypothetical protein